MATVEPVKELANKYRSEFEETYKALRHRTTDLKETAQQELANGQQAIADLQPTIRQTKENVVATLQNMEPIDVPNYGKMLDTFAWAAVMQCGAFISSIAASMILWPLMSAIFDTFPVVGLAYAALPTLAVLHLRKNASKDSDETTRFKLLGFAAVEGLLVGFLLSNQHLITMQPLALLTPLSIAVVGQSFGAQLGRDRPTILGVLLGSGIVAHLTLGMVLGQLSFPYVVLSLLYAGVGFCTLQFYFRYMAGDYTRSAHVFMLGYFVGALLCQALVFFLFAGAKESMDVAREAAHAAGDTAHAMKQGAAKQAAHAAEAAKHAADAAKSYFKK